VPAPAAVGFEPAGIAETEPPSDWPHPARKAVSNSVADHIRGLKALADLFMGFSCLLAG
jgi:hypothetical protein